MRIECREEPFMLKILNKSSVFVMAMACALSSFAASPPALVNYQGVLRDSANKPLTDPYDMIFRFYSASTGGTLLLTDTHNSVAPSGQVSASNGLFTAQLGAGTITPGSEPNLAEMFRDNASVYLAIQVGTETLSPRVRVTASAYAQNAKSLDGNDASAFATAAHNQDASTIATGTLGTARGGTGLSSPGTSGYVLTSNGTTWTSAAIPTFTEGDAVIGNEVTNATNATLTRSGSGNGSSPYTLGLNLGNANTWSAQQTFSSAQVTGALKDSSGDAGTSGQILLSSGTGTNWANTTALSDGDWTISGSDMYATVSGKVGIGTTAPMARLDVDGSFSVSTNSGEALDQSQTSGSNIWNGTSQWQSFTAGDTGALTEVDIYLQSPYTSSDTTGTLSIYSGEGTGGTLLATQSVVITVAFGWHYFPIAIPPQVTSGQVYTFGVTVAGYDRTWWETQSGNPYTNGRWWYDATYDTMFKTWVSAGTGGGFAVTSGGNVGIGQPNPGFPLNFGSTMGDKISFYETSGNHHGIGYQDSLLQIHCATSSDAIAFGYGSSASFTEAMRIKGSGNVGIGTTTPAAGLHVMGSGWFGAHSGSLGTAAGEGVRVFMDTGSTPSIGRIFAYDYASGGGSLDLTLQSNGGGVGIGNITPAYKLQVNQDSAAKPNGGNWTNPSDLRLKKNIRPFTDGLGVVERINPVRYQYNGLAGMPKDMECIGVLAQDMLPVAPYTVGTFRAKLDEKAEAQTELLDFNASALTFVMINAIKELDARTRALVPATAEAAEIEAKKARRHALPGPAGTEQAKTPLEDGAGGTPEPGTGVAPGLFQVCESVEVGDVLATDASRPGAFCLARLASDPGIVGIVTGVPPAAVSPSRDEVAGRDMWEVPVATGGVVYCKADATYGPIRLNDLLCASATPGQAMRAQPTLVNGFPMVPSGTILGKALEPLESGTGLIKVLVMLR
jgi:hypothetical protein